MPTYDYRCKACGHALEVFQSITEGPKRKCPACGRNQLERQIGAGAGILFKGSGFYQTDYRSASYEKAAKADSRPAPAAGGDAPQAPASQPQAPAAGTAQPAAMPAKGKGGGTDG
jgi:putative FmdB family regulatory protein